MPPVLLGWYFLINQNISEIQTPSPLKLKYNTGVIVVCVLRRETVHFTPHDNISL